MNTVTTIARLKKLRDYMSKIPPYTGRFEIMDTVSFSTMQRSKTKPQHSCGSVGCVAGHCLDVFPKHTAYHQMQWVVYKGKKLEKLPMADFAFFVETLLGLSPLEAGALTLPSGYPRRKVTPPDVVEHLDKLISKYEQKLKKLKKLKVKPSGVHHDPSSAKPENSIPTEGYI